MQAEMQVPIAPLDRQAAFNRVYTHFVYEGNPPSDDGGFCCYRDLAGNACAAGILLPDEVYLPEMEYTCGSKGASAATVWEKFPQVRPYWGTYTDVERFITALQVVHDAVSGSFDQCARGVWTAEIAARLLKVAHDYGLTLPPHPDA